MTKSRARSSKIMTIYKFLHKLLMEPFKAMSLLWCFLQVLNKICILSSSSKDLTSELFGAQILLGQLLLKPPKNQKKKSGLCFSSILLGVRTGTRNTWEQSALPRNFGLVFTAKSMQRSQYSEVNIGRKV